MVAQGGSNAITLENAKPGNPPSQWDVAGAGDASIQGFATDISVNLGETVRFKVKTDASNYRLDVYRLGYYQGLGARLIATVLPSAPLPQSQPNPVTDAATGLVDCGNWAESASWPVPANATSGIYVAKLVRADTGGASHVIFVVRDDAGTSNLLFQTSDTTWQAYNNYGGNSLYVGSPAGRAYKVSYNRPLSTRGNSPEDSPFRAEYPMVRWLEANGYDVSYSSGVDTDRRGNLLLRHRAFLSVGHDEYWSGGQRASVEAARSAGVHLGFFSGNESFWKTRWEASIAGPTTNYRTLVCYKETHANAKIDPTPAWTGSWRDPRFSPPADGGRPENALTGTLFAVNGPAMNAIQVPAAYGTHRFWRNTSVATQTAGQTATFGVGTLGYEWDQCPDNGFRPPGQMNLSQAVVTNVSVLQDYGSTYVTDQATHNLSLYRHGSGALVFGAGTIQWSWGLDDVHDAPTGTAIADQRMRQATVNLLADMGIQPATLQAGLVAATQSADSTPPASVIGSPSAGATVQAGVSVNVTGTATDAGGGRVWGVEVSTDGGSTWHSATGTSSWSYVWTPGTAGSVTLKSRAVDDSGNVETPSAGVGVTVAAGQGTTIWPSSAVPAQVDAGADSSVELGVRFRSDVAGTVTAIRFYKAAANAGPHVASLWTNGGTLLARVTFTGESASGWQQAALSSPVALAANTLYVVSYHCNAGHYSASGNYFASAGADSGPLHAPSSAVAGGNGVYRYGASAVFPNQTYLATNYWVDVVFKVSGPPPTLSSVAVTPANASIAAGASQQFTATGTYSDGSTQNLTAQAAWSSSNPAAATVNAGSGLAAGVAAGSTTISASSGGLTGSTTLTVQAAPLVITTAAPLPGAVLNAAYSASLAASGGKTPYQWSVAGNSLPPGLALNANTGTISGTPTASGSFSFTATVNDASAPAQSVSKGFSITVTATAPPSSEILVITDPSNPFSQYYAEILLAEGLNSYVVKDLASVSSATLAQFDVVLLGAIPLTTAQVTMLSDWVNAGGNLVAMRPDKKLAGLLGLIDAGSTISEGYLLVNTASGPGIGIVNQTIQFHGTADRYSLGSGATSVATLYTNAQTAASNPAVTLRSVGSNGGQAAAFAYDLARSVVFTRQGNPAWADQDRDGLPPVRSDDLFFGAASFDPQPDWVDLNKVAIPQADEQQRLLANLVISMNSDRVLLPRFWYFPNGQKAAVVMTGDDHANGGTAGRFDQYSALSTPGASVPDWQAIRSTSYVYPNTPLSDAQAVAYNAAGFEIGLHLNTNLANYTPDSLTTQFTDQLNLWRASFPSLPVPATHRIHAIAWSGYTILPEVGLTFGIRLDTSYYYWPGSWITDRPGMFTGSGMPMRFAKATGETIDVYQAVTQMTDESGQSYPATCNALLDKALGPEGYYGAFVANMHTDEVSSPGSDAIVSSATSRGVPVISARQLLTWLDGRNASTIRSVAWNAGTQTQTFSVTANAGARGLMAMVPVPGNFSVNSVKRDGSPVTFSVRLVKGVTYAFFPAATTGNYAVGFTTDTTPPTVTGVSPAAGATGVSPATKVAVNFSEPMNAATVNGSNLTLKNAAGNPVSATVAYDALTFVATLTPVSPLALSATYTATVKGGAGGVADTSGNVLASDFAWSFNTAANYTLWPSSAVPAQVDAGADSSVELGVRFRSDVAGTVTAIRFYKAAANAGPHVASLWTNGGTLLARVTFTGESASGWQQAALSSPVALAANTLYVVSYHCNAGHYSASGNYFASAGADSGPLHAPSSAVAGGNGVYRYGASAVFPNQTYLATNYWVDVVFTPGP